MTIKKSALTDIAIYLLVLFSPVFLVRLLHLRTQQSVVSLSTLLYVLGAGTMIYLYHKRTELTLWEQTPRWKNPLWVPLLGITGIFLAIIAQGLAFQLESFLFGTEPTSQNTESILTLIVENPAFLIPTAIAGPIMEEFVFRRSLTSIFNQYLGFWIAAIISSALFSLAHADGHFLVYFSMGMVFSLLYKLTGKIWTSIIAHTGMNAIVVIIQLALLQ